MRRRSFPNRPELGMEIPVWMYWEGDCPEWIRACQETVFRHADDVRLLSRNDFEKLRDRDYDINLDRLHVAHRADYVRAFLLLRYGGLWVDSDCIIMKRLEPIRNKLMICDFAGYRERTGHVANSFMGSRAGGRIISLLYHQICAVLRDGKPLDWTSIGSEPLTEILSTDQCSWHEISCEQIQPVCWCYPDVFFALRKPEEHDQFFDPAAVCYMLSNMEVQWFQRQNPLKNILDSRTFFSYLLAKSSVSN